MPINKSQLDQINPNGRTDGSVDVSRYCVAWGHHDRDEIAAHPTRPDLTSSSRREKISGFLLGFLPVIETSYRQKNPFLSIDCYSYPRTPLVSRLQTGFIIPGA